MRKIGLFFFVTAIFSFALLSASEPASETRRDVDEFYAKGLAAFSQNDYEAAGSQFLQGMDLDPENPVLAYYYGLSLLRRGEETEAEFWLQRGAELELTARGQLIYVPRYLQPIQGNERTFLEQIRQKVKTAWQAKEKRRERELYGENINRHRNYLTAPVSKDEKAAVSLATGDALPIVAPISPLTRPEVDGSVSEVLANYGVSEIIHLTDEYETDSEGNVLKDDEGNPIKKTTLSTKDQIRQAAGERKQQERAEAEANFVDIYSDQAISNDNTVFGGREQASTVNQNNKNIFISTFYNIKDSDSEDSEDAELEESENSEDTEASGDSEETENGEDDPFSGGDK